jgi:hypothetical protein
MTLCWKTLGLSAFLATALTAVPVRADTDTPKLTDSQKLDQLVEQCKEIQKSLATLDTIKQDLKTLQSRTEKLEERVNALHSHLNSIVQANKETADALNERIRRLEADLEALRGQLGPQTRVSGYGPTAAPAAPPAPGTIRLRNTYPGLVSIVVNGTSYELAPGDTRDLPGQPAGPFTYEVLGIQPLKTVALGPKDSFTITVFPR